MKMIWTSCKQCGKKFQAKTLRERYCCRECRDQARIERDRYYARIHKKKRKRSKPEPAKAYETIEEVQAKARELGLTYGQYEALLFVERGRYGEKANYSGNDRDTAKART